MQLAFNNVFKDAGIQKTVVTVVSQVVVSENDPAFKKPSKPIGSFMSLKEAKTHQERDGWQVIEDAGRGYRRVVASPMPKELIELPAIKALTEQDMLVIAVGGGGIPVYKDQTGVLHGIEAVVDKDYASGLLAKELNADYFIISTGVERVSINFNKPDEKKLDSMTLSEARLYLDKGYFAQGSMLPKVKSMIDFVSSTGKVGIITNPENISKAIHKRRGTWIIP